MFEDPGKQLYWLTFTLAQLFQEGFTLSYRNHKEPEWKKKQHHLDCTKEASLHGAVYPVPHLIMRCTKKTQLAKLFLVFIYWNYFIRSYLRGIMYQTWKIIYSLAKEIKKHFTYENFYRSHWELRNSRITLLYQTLGKKQREKYPHQAGAVKHPGITCSASRMTPEHQLITDLERNKNLLLDEFRKLLQLQKPWGQMTFLEMNSAGAQS